MLDALEGRLMQLEKGNCELLCKLDAAEQSLQLWRVDEVQRRNEAETPNAVAK